MQAGCVRCVGFLALKNYHPALFARPWIALRAGMLQMLLTRAGHLEVGWETGKKALEGNFCSHAHASNTCNIQRKN